MRPTDLNFRSPKEKTGEYRVLDKTYDGRTLNFPDYKLSNPTFAKEKRFMRFAKMTGESTIIVGPGSYNSSNCNIGTNYCQVLYVIYY